VESFHGEFLFNSFDGLDEFAIHDFEGHLHLAARADADEFVAVASHGCLKEMVLVDIFRALYLESVSSWASELRLGTDGDGVGVDFLAVVPVSNDDNLVPGVGNLGH
jgi:hypothetical protein